MSLKKAKALFTSLSSRLAFSYLVFFLISVVLIFGGLFYSIHSFLVQKDHDILEARFQHYQQMFERDGLPALKKINTDSALRTRSALFLISLKDPHGQPLFLHLPEEHENFIVTDLVKATEGKQPKEKPYWYYVPSKDGDEDALEVFAAKLDNDYFLQVGSRTDSRDEVTERILSVFAALLLPFLLVTTIGVFVIARRSLLPVRRLIETVTNIKNGNLSSRVPMHETQDELHELGSLFNEMIERLQDLMNAMKETLDNVAHDLKTPITRLKAAGELALRSDDDQEIRGALSESIENADEIQSLIQTIMTVSEINANIVQLKKSVFDVSQVIEEVIDLYFFVADEKSIQIEFTNMGPVEFEGDRVLIKQAVANLVDNALKYSKWGKDIFISLTREDHQVVIQVRDQGIGMNESDLPRIWERLYRSDKSRHEPGLGLGLSLVKAIVEAHKGQVTVESKVNEGSTFTIHLDDNRR